MASPQPDASQSAALPDKLFTDTSVAPSPAAPDGVTLSLTHAPMVRVGLLANKYRQLTSQYFLREFGVGATDWRLLVVLTKSRDMAAGQISALIGIDKAAVSRSLNALAALGLATGDLRSAADPRVKLWRLTADGQELHARMLASSLQINKTLFAGFSEEDIATLLRLSNALLDNLEPLARKLGDTQH